MRLHLEYCLCWVFPALRNKLTNQCKSSWLKGLSTRCTRSGWASQVWSVWKQMVMGKFCHCLQTSNSGSDRKQSQALRESVKGWEARGTNHSREKGRKNLPQSLCISSCGNNSELKWKRPWATPPKVEMSSTWSKGCCSWYHSFLPI